ARCRVCDRLEVAHVACHVVERAILWRTPVIDPQCMRLPQNRQDDSPHSPRTPHDKKTHSFCSLSLFPPPSPPPSLPGRRAIRFEFSPLPPSVAREHRERGRG